MRSSFGLICAAALMGIAPGCQAADTASYKDAETGFTFSQYNAQYTIGRSITYRIAVPSPVPANSAYDVVLQVVAPNEVAWAGLAWGGSMIANPLTVAWSNSPNVVVSSRYATQHAAPSAYADASYELFKPGTHVNSTHWQYTVKCTGCTSYNTATGSRRILNPSGANRLAFAYSGTRPANPSSNVSSISVHDVYNYWSHDFSIAGNPDFSSLMVRNLGHA
ncbi:CBD9-like protein [Venustampulla echinocandica]|uniref:CBD9-like protein n=1 Tax=Venustampulla echinocandica TaxID=2656787 RepID=A0A370TBF5_9HELO|nr:CBD9-like protein [Venustampulla echinocandica]RDL31382.1 CBD9-like protein [Venustampulla echinocandica]